MVSLAGPPGREPAAVEDTRQNSPGHRRILEAHLEGIGGSSEFVADQFRVELNGGLALIDAGEIADGLELAPLGFDAYPDSWRIARWIAMRANRDGDTALAAKAYQREYDIEPSLGAFEGLQGSLPSEQWEAILPGLIAGAVESGAMYVLLACELWDEAIAAIDAAEGEEGVPVAFDDWEDWAATLAPVRPAWSIDVCEINLHRPLRRENHYNNPHVVSWLEILLEAHEAAGTPENWNTYLADFRAKNRRRSSLMAATKRLTAL